MPTPSSSCRHERGGPLPRLESDQTVRRATTRSRRARPRPTRTANCPDHPPRVAPLRGRRPTRRTPARSTAAGSSGALAARRRRGLLVRDPPGPKGRRPLPTLLPARRPALRRRGSVAAGPAGTSPRAERSATGPAPGVAAAASRSRRRRGWPNRRPAMPTGTPRPGARRGSDDRRGRWSARRRHPHPTPAQQPGQRRTPRPAIGVPRVASLPRALRPAAGARTSTSRRWSPEARRRRPPRAAKQPRLRSPRSAPPTCRAGPSAEADRTRRSGG